MTISAAASAKRENGIKAALVVRNYYSTKNADGVYNDLRRKFDKLRKEAPPGDEFGEPDHRPCLGPLCTFADMVGLGERATFVARYDSSEGEKLTREIAVKIQPWVLRVGAPLPELVVDVTAKKHIAILTLVLGWELSIYYEAMRSKERVIHRLGLRGWVAWGRPRGNGGRGILL